MTTVSVIYPSPMIAVRDMAVGYQHGFALNGCTVHAIDWPKRAGFYGRALKANSYPDTGNASLRMAAEAVVIECLRQRSDLVVIVSGMGTHPDLFTLLKRAGLITALVTSESPYQDESMLPMAAHVDHVFVNDKASVQAFRGVNPRTWYLPPAHDPEVHRPVLVGEDERCDVFLCGTGFGERVKFLEVVDWTGIDFRLYGLWALADDSPLRPYYRGGDGAAYLSNDRLARHYSGATIALNLHRTDVGWGAGGATIAGAYSVNPRAYEIAGCGAFQLCDDSRPELRRVFGPTVPTYHTPDELGRLVRAFLRPELAGLRRAHAAHSRARVAGHTYAARAATLLACVESAGSVAA